MTLISWFRYGLKESLRQLKRARNMPLSGARKEDVICWQEAVDRNRRQKTRINKKIKNDTDD